MFDYHVHSSFSDDCSIDMDTIVKRAVQLGLKEVCFTDHIDFDVLPDGLGYEFYLQEYTEKIQELQNRYGSKIILKKGVEIGYQPHIIERCDRFVEKWDFDFVLASLHTLERKEVHLGDFTMYNSPKEAYERYFTEIYSCIDKKPAFSVLAHFDLLKRHIKYDDKRVLRDNFDIIEATFKKLAYEGKGIEVNTSGFRYNIGATLPSMDFLQLYKELGGEIITFGSDTHGEKNLCYEYDYTLNLLRKVGYKYITTFTKMKPQFIRI